MNEGRDVLKKFVYIDEGKEKVVKGYVESEEDFLYNIIGFKTNEPITIGKRAIIAIKRIEEKKNE